MNLKSKKVSSFYWNKFLPKKSYSFWLEKLLAKLPIRNVLRHIFAIYKSKKSDLALIEVFGWLFLCVMELWIPFPQVMKDASSVSKLPTGVSPSSALLACKMNPLKVVELSDETSSTSTWPPGETSLLDDICRVTGGSPSWGSKPWPGVIRLQAWGNNLFKKTLKRLFCLVILCWS